MVEIDWVEIPGGEFVLGLSNAQAQKLARGLPKLLNKGRAKYLQKELDRETPERVVYLDTFYISRFPITWKQYLEFARSNHRYAERNWDSDELDRLEQAAEEVRDHPADTTWHFAMAFCDWIGARLPTSAEWEKAARGTDGHLYPWGNTWDPTRGNFVLDRERWPHKTSPVAAYPSGQSPYGVMDMVGNTYEWTLSTLIGLSGGMVSREVVICRSCSCDFAPRTDDPDWFRNRVTHILLNEMHFGGAHLVGFRPVLDEWHIEFAR